jgi:hypothetical protein
LHTNVSESLPCMSLCFLFCYIPDNFLFGFIAGSS